MDSTGVAEQARLNSSYASFCAVRGPLSDQAAMDQIADAGDGDVADPSSRAVYYNPKFEELYAPVAGPVHPTNKDGLARGATNHKLGMVEVGDSTTQSLKTSTPLQADALHDILSVAIGLGFAHGRCSVGRMLTTAHGGYARRPLT